jgi:hypothetical protein
MKYHIVSAALICSAMVLYMTGAMDRGTDLGVFSRRFLLRISILDTRDSN